MAKFTKEEIVESLKEYTVLELNDLIKLVEETFGVTAAAAVAAAPAEAEDAGAAKGPSEVSLILKGIGTGSKVAVIKAVQATRRLLSPPALKSKSSNLDFTSQTTSIPAQRTFPLGGVLAL